MLTYSLSDAYILQNQEKGLHQQISDLSGLLTSEKKTKSEINYQLESEVRTRTLGEMRLKELEDMVVRAREETSLVAERLQRDLLEEIEVLYLFQFYT